MVIRSPKLTFAVTSPSPSSYEFLLCRTSWHPKTLCLPGRSTVVVEHKFLCLTHSEAKQTEVSGFGAEKSLSQGPSKENKQLVLKSPELPEGCQRRVFKGKFVGGEGEGCRVCDSLLIGWWWGNRVVFRESQSSAFTFQPVWGPVLVLSLRLPSSTWVGTPAPVEEHRDK